jgi:glucose uptake protein GlcU
MGNLLSIVAIPSVGYAVAYPFLQAAVAVSGLWGIYVFHEITRRSVIAVFWIATAVVVLGAFLLAAGQ